MLSASTAVAIDGTDTLGDLVTALTTIGAAGGDLSHWLVSPQVEGTLMTAKDGAGNYAFLRDARTDNGSIGSVFGRDVLRSSSVYNNPATGADVVGFAGDFARSAVWGSVEGYPDQRVRSGDREQGRHSAEPVAAQHVRDPRRG